MIGTVSLDASADRNAEITKSSIEVANTIIKLAKMAGPSSGNNTVRSAWIGVAPRSWAASSTSRPIDSRRPRTITTTYDTENVMWPSSIAGRPSGMLVYRLSNTRNSIAPITISGVDSGTSISRFDARAVRPRQRASPSASPTPSGVAISIVSAASVRLLIIAWRRAGSWNSDRWSSPHHQRIEKPCHVLRDRPELNENWTAISTGTIDHRMYTHVTVRQHHGWSPRVVHPRTDASHDRPHHRTSRVARSVDHM